MIDKLDFIEERYEELNKAISDPDIISNQEEWKKLVIEHADIEEIVNVYRKYRQVLEGIEEVEEMLRDKPDPEFKEMLDQELAELSPEKEELEQNLRTLLIPTDPNDKKNVIVEIRGEPAVMRQPYLEPICLECIPAMQSVKAGRAKCSVPILRI